MNSPANHDISEQRVRSTGFKVSKLLHWLSYLASSIIFHVISLLLRLGSFD